MTLFDDYVQVVSEQRELYGSKTVVLFQVGTFWEILDCDKHQGCDVPSIASILNIQVTRRNKNIQEVSRTNNSLAGFNVSSLHKYLPLLVSALYTVVLVSEDGVCEKSKAMRRKISRVVSKGTWLDDPGRGPSTESRIACLFVQNTGSRVSGCGLATLDLQTGCCDAAESSSSEDGDTVIDAICCSLSGVDVTELIIIGDRTESQSDRASLSRLVCEGITHDRSGEPSQFSKTLLQDHLLRKVYRSTGFLSPAEFIGLERQPLALAAFTCLLDFAHRHDETIIHNLPVPGTHDRQRGFMLTSPSTMRDLDMLDVSTQKGLASVLNCCLTGMGRRLFHHRMTRPITDVDELRLRYDCVDSMMGVGEPVRRELKGVGDFERSWRRVTGRTMNASEDVLMMRRALNHIREALVVSSGSNQGPEQGLADVACVLGFLQDVDEQGLLCVGLFEDLDHARQTVEIYTDVHIAWQGDVNRALGCTRLHLIKFEDGHATCTLKRYKEVLAVLGGDLAMLVDQTTSRVRFTGSNVRRASTECALARLELDKVYAKRWTEVVDGWYLHHHQTMSRLIRKVAEMDVYACIAIDAIAHDMRRPDLEDGVGTDSSKVSCIGLRHPLSERIHTKTMYVSNDLALDRDGVLLYGVNASGKSSLCKAVALAVVMAQAGLFVACRSLQLVPYHRFFSRMASRDDIHLGRSTFVVELMELRSILRRSDARTLVVGDELCSGTESASAISIVGAVCLELIASGTSFILATHLHELGRLSETRGNPRLRIFHLGVTYDVAHDALVYDRQLCDGPGKALYGLEVARAMHMPANFMARAQTIRREVLGIDESLAPSPSRFNSSVVLDRCGLCGLHPAQETHHIVPQRQADAHGRIRSDVSGDFDKNVAHNLLPLCHACHLSCHRSGHESKLAYLSTTLGTRLCQT